MSYNTQVWLGLVWTFVIFPLAVFFGVFGPARIARNELKRVGAHRWLVMVVPLAVFGTVVLFAQTAPLSPLAGMVTLHVVAVLAMIVLFVRRT